MVLGHFLCKEVLVERPEDTDLIFALAILEQIPPGPDDPAILKATRMIVAGPTIPDKFREGCDYWFRVTGGPKDKEDKELEA